MLVKKGRVAYETSHRSLSNINMVTQMMDTLEVNSLVLLDGGVIELCQVSTLKD